MNAQEFEKIDYRVMGCAYASQNELGRLCDECAYEADLKARLEKVGFRSILTHVPVKLTHKDFSKTYYLDLLVEGALYELKTAAAFSGEHESQLLNYLFLLGLQRGKLLNFRPAKVQGQIVATGLTPDERHRVSAVTKDWIELTTACSKLRHTMGEIVADWGAFLDIDLYQEALIHFLGGAEAVQKNVALTLGGLKLGTQQMLLLGNDVAFRLTAFADTQPIMGSHLRRLLALTGLKAIQWINLNHSQVEFTTLLAKPGALP